MDINNFSLEVVAKEKVKLDALLEASKKSTNEELEMLQAMTKVRRATFHATTSVIEVGVPLSEGLTNSLDKDEKDFLKACKQSGTTITPFPNRSNKLRNIIQSIRIKKHSLSCGGSDYITELKLKEFLEYFADKEAEFEEEKKAILKTYDEDIARFKERAEAFFKKSHPSSYDSLMKELNYACSKSKEAYVNGFKLSLATDFNEDEIDWGENEESLKQMLNRLKRNAIVNDYNGIIANSLQLAWQTLFLYIHNMNKTNIDDLTDSKRRVAFAKQVNEMKESNSFGDARLDSIYTEMLTLARYNSAKETVQDALDIFAIMYKMGVDTQNHLPMVIKSNRSTKMGGQVDIKFPYENFTADDLLDEYQMMVEV